MTAHAFTAVGDIAAPEDFFSMQGRVAGVLSNSGSAHEFTGGFSVFGTDVTGSTGTLFLYGIVVGAAALLGLSLS